MSYVKDHQYAIKDGNLVSIADIGKEHNGKKCGCICTKCKGPLIAKNRGKKRIPHFAHDPGSECKGETLAHIKAKAIIMEEKCIYVPFLDYDFKKIKFDNVEEEKLIKDSNGNESNYRADLICTNDGREIIIEIVVTSDLDEEKQKFINTNNIETLVIYIKKVRQKKIYYERVFEPYLKQYGVVDDFNYTCYLENHDLNDPIAIQTENFRDIVLKKSYRIWEYNEKENDEFKERLETTMAGKKNSIIHTLKYRNEKEHKIARWEAGFKNLKGAINPYTGIRNT
jgi:hypothetical protein